MFPAIIPRPMSVRLTEAEPIWDAPLRPILTDIIPVMAPEAYRISSTPAKIVISAGGQAGLFYGSETLSQLMNPNEKALAFPFCEIEDAPRFGWRGSMLDVARHYMPKEFVLKYIDLLAMHKMNVLHLHLTDDQGWRIEIKKYPKLTEIGAWRPETVYGYEGDAPGDETPHGGFYTQDDIREIVAYAAARFVTVVPEIEMPGHAGSALAAYPELSNGIQSNGGTSTHWGVHENIFNVNDSTFEFLEDVLTEVMELFPSEFIHIGGDEAPKTQWLESPSARSKMAEMGLRTGEALQSWFIRRTGKFLSANGRRLLGWDEILEGGLAPGRDGDVLARDRGWGRSRQTRT